MNMQLRLPVILIIFAMGISIPNLGCDRNASLATLDPETWAEKVLSGMTDRQKIGQLVMATTTWESGLTFPQDAYGPPSQRQRDHMRRMVAEYHAGSVIIYNWSRSETMARFNKQLQEWSMESNAGVPLFISADLEYGVAQRIPAEATVFPRQMGIAATGDPEAAYEQGRITAMEALATGFNWSYSPVVDVNVNPRNPVIGVRSFGERYTLVSEMSRAMILGSQEHGVLATPKHFPGHGDTDFDSHYDLSTVTYDLETLREIHLPPFQAAFDAGADAVMTAHVIIEAIDPTVPATLSRQALTGLLREEMGFEGIIVTDAMSMHAIDHNWGAGEAAVMAVQAGADIIMATGTEQQQAETFEALYQAYVDGEITEERLNESLLRILRIKHKYGLHHGFSSPDPARALEVTTDTEHRRIARDIAARSITLVRNQQILPFDRDEELTTLVAGVAYTRELADLVREAGGGEVIMWDYGRGPTDNDPTPEAILEAIRKAEEADRILLFTYSWSELPEGQAKLAEALAIMGKPMAVVALGLPYDLVSIPMVPAFVATYSLDRWPDATPTPVVWEAAVDMLFGEQPGGQLPVSLGRNFPVGHGLSY
ncbi:MAG: glycoside hydrolase family 3 protein [Balneolaceae bacterium]|nr:MAG: glycoside hydrolase family 3 protein [Balneolaceae bacterium]